MTKYVIGPDVAMRLARHLRRRVHRPDQLQADAYVTLDRRQARAVKNLVTVAPIEDLF